MSHRAVTIFLPGPSVFATYCQQTMTPLKRENLNRKFAPVGTIPYQIKLFPFLLQSSCQFLIFVGEEKEREFDLKRKLTTDPNEACLTDVIFDTMPTFKSDLSHFCEEQSDQQKWKIRTEPVCFLCSGITHSHIWNVAVANRSSCRIHLECGLKGKLTSANLTDLNCPSHIETGRQPDKDAFFM